MNQKAILDMPVKQPHLYNICDRVRIVGPGRMVGSIVEVQPNYQPRRLTYYTVYVPADPEPMYRLCCEDELEKVDDSVPLGFGPVQRPQLESATDKPSGG